MSGILRRARDALLARIENRLARSREGAKAARRTHLNAGDRFLRLAASALARTQPLVPAPGWRFGSDVERDELGVRLRKWIFWHFEALAAEAPATLRWHHGLRVSIPLGGDAARCLFVGGRIDPNEFAFLEGALAPGQVFVDAGANDGLYSLFASRKVGAAGQVLAIEPSPRELDRLRAHIALNRAGNIRIAACAVGAAPGRASLNVADARHAGHNTLGEFGHSDTRSGGRAEVVVERLDDLVRREGLARVDVLKLDVEGAELAALEGAAQTIARDHPLLLVEVFDDALRAQGASAAALLEKLRSIGYEILTFDAETGLPRRAGEGEALSLNIVAAYATRVSGKVSPA